MIFSHGRRRRSDAPSAAHEPAVPAWAAQLSAASNYVATIQYLQFKAPQKKRHFYADNDELSLRPWSEDMLTVSSSEKSHASVPAEEDDIVVAQLKPFILRAAENTQKVQNVFTVPFEMANLHTVLMI